MFVDLDCQIHMLLSAEGTNLYVRHAIEALAIVRLANLRAHHPNDGISDDLLCKLVESLLEADYTLLIDSISNVLINSVGVCVGGLIHEQVVLLFIVLSQF